MHHTDGRRWSHTCSPRPWAYIIQQKSPKTENGCLSYSISSKRMFRTSGKSFWWSSKTMYHMLLNWYMTYVKLLGMRSRVCIQLSPHPMGSNINDSFRVLKSRPSYDHSYHTKRGYQSSWKPWWCTGRRTYHERLTLCKLSSRFSTTPLSLVMIGYPSRRSHYQLVGSRWCQVDIFRKDWDTQARKEHHHTFLLCKYTNSVFSSNNPHLCTLVCNPWNILIP